MNPKPRGAWPGDDLLVTGIDHDDRRLPAGGVFVCVRGATRDGHDLAERAVRRGAVLIIGERDQIDDAPHYLQVDDSRKALALLACAWHDHPSRRLTVIGVTGTNGKSSVTWMVQSMAAAAGKRAAVFGTLGIGSPDRLRPQPFTTPVAPDFQAELARVADEGYELVAVEVSSHALHQRRTYGTRFPVVAFTNLSQDHLDFHGDMESYATAKGLLFRSWERGPEETPALAVVNGSDPYIGKLLGESTGTPDAAKTDVAETDVATTDAAKTDVAKTDVATTDDGGKGHDGTDDDVWRFFDPTEDREWLDAGPSAHPFEAKPAKKALADPKSVPDGDTGADMDAGAGARSYTETDADSEPDSETLADSGPNSDLHTDSGPDLDSHAEYGPDSEAHTDSTPSAGRWQRLTDPAAAEIEALQVEPRPQGLFVRVRHPKGEMDLQTKLLGTFQAQNLLTAAGIGLRLGMDPDAIRRGLEATPGIPGRMERVDRGQPFLVVVDFAHTPEALLRSVESLRPFVDGRVVLVFGCGGERDKTKRFQMGRVATFVADQIIVTDDNPRGEEPSRIRNHILDGIRSTEGTAIDCASRERAIEAALQLAGAGDAVFIAGKGHETVQIQAHATVPFDDREVAGRLLEKLGFSKESGA